MKAAAAPRAVAEEFGTSEPTEAQSVAGAVPATGESLAEKVKSSIADLHAEHGRWLIDQHNARGDSAQARLVAILGFIGVMLSLLTTLGPEVFGAQRWILLLGQAFLTIAAVMCVLGMLPVKMEVPGIVQSRRNWRAQLLGERTGSAHADVTEMYLQADDLQRPSVIDRARSAADQRVSYLKSASVFLLLGILMLYAMALAR